MSVGAQETCRLARERGLVVRWDAAPGLGLILASGPDCVDFLQARLTSDVRALVPGRGQLSAKLTGRGELVGYFSLHRMPDLGQPFPTFLLLLPRADLPGLLADLVSTRIAEDVMLEDVTDQFEALLVQGPETPAYIKKALDIAGLDDEPEYSLGGAAGLSSDYRSAGLPADLLVLSRSFTGDPGCLLLWSAGTTGGDLAGSLVAAARKCGLAVLGDDDSSATVWRWLTVEAGWPVLGRDFEPARLVLPKTGLEQRVVSVTKGCFPGQEVVARIRTYGSVPVSLRGLVFARGDASLISGFPRPGHDLMTAGKKIGSWGTGAWAVTQERPVALVWLDRDNRTPGTRLEVVTEAGVAEAEVVVVPFFRAANRSEKARHLHDRAIHLFSGGDDDGALALLEEALGLDPDLQDAYEALGVILGRTERYLQAIEIFRRLEELAPAEPMVHTNLSLFYMKIGDTAEAERQKAQATLTRFAAAGDLSQAKAMKEASEVASRKEAQRKIDMFTAVLDLDPDDPLALTGMGQALADLGDYDSADEWLVRALEVQNDSSTLYAARGKVLEALGRPGEAEAVYRRGIAVASRRGDLMPLKDMEHRLLLLAT